jgi:hypothetical protein
MLARVIIDDKNVMLAGGTTERGPDAAVDVGRDLRRGLNYR